MEEGTQSRKTRRSKRPAGGTHQVRHTLGLRRVLFSLRAMMVVCVIAIAVFAAILVYNGNEYAKGDQAYAQVRSLLHTQPATAATSSEQTPASPTASAAVPAAPAGGSGLDFSVLQAVNADAVGWLSAPGRTIDYPVVLGQDNTYYLTHLFNRQRNKLGSIFMDYRNHGDFSDQNSVIYGHNMKDGSMFASLSSYKDQAYYDSFPSMMLYTPKGDYQIELFAGIVANGDYQFVRFSFQDDKDFLDYIASLKEKSRFKSNTEVLPTDRIVTLCTCSYEFSNARYALFGKLVPAEKQKQ